MARTRHALVALLAVVVVAAAVPAGGLAAAENGGASPATLAGAADADATQDCSYPFSKVDASGTEVTVESAPETVVTLSPSAAQTMWELGAQDKVIGVTKYATYLEGADEKTNVSGAGFTAVVVEKVVALEPDLVLAPNVITNDTVAKLRDAGVTVYRFRAAGSLEDIEEKTSLTGQLVGECAAAEDAVARMESRLATVEEAVQGSERPDVLFVFGPGETTAGTGTFIHTAIETAGGDNVAANANISFYGQISPEVVAARDPEFIVTTTSSAGLPKSEVYNDTTAVREGNVVRVDSNFISQPAPQITRAIVTMAKAFHPEAYAAANATPTQSPTGTPTETPPPTDATTPTPTPADSPGFGLLAALVALLAGGAVLRRRRGR